MGDSIEDDWNYSSPIDSPSSSLPQSIRELLDNVESEWSDGKLGAYCIDEEKKTMATDVPHEEQFSSPDEQTLQIDDMKEMTAEPHRQTQVSFDKTHEHSQTGPCNVASEDSQGSATKKIHQDFAEPSSFIDREITRNPENLLRLKKGCHGIMGRTVADYRRTKVSRWIKIDCPTKNLSPHKVTLTAQDHQMNPFHPEYESPPAVRTEDIEIMGAFGLKTPIEGQYEVNQDDSKRKASIELGATAKKAVLEAHSVTNKIDLNKKATPQQSLLHASKPRTQMKMNIDLTDDDEYHIDAVSVQRWKVDESSPSRVDKMWAAGNSKMTEKNTRNPDQISQSCFPIQKQAVQSCETIDLSDDEDQEKESVHINPAYVELTDDSQSSECKSEKGVNHRVNPGNFKSKKHCSSDDSDTTMEGQSPKGSPAHGRPGAFQEGNEQQSDKSGASQFDTYYQDDANLESADSKSDKNNTLKQMDLGIDDDDDVDGDDGDDDDYDDAVDDDENQINKTRLRKRPTKDDETLHNELKEKYINMNFSNEIPPIQKGYGEYEPVCEEIEEFARACDESPMQEEKNVRMKLLDDGNQQALNKNVIHRNINTKGTKKDELVEETWETSVTIWRRELLSSDFNLIYANLRAVLMRNLSKDDKHRLVQTMIATMSEIEEVTMGEGNPTQPSVRCETPESSTEFDESEEDEKSEDESDSDKKEEIQKEPSSLKLQVYGEDIRPERAAHDRLHLRERETALNLRRIKELMSVCPDGTLVCRVCRKKDIPDGRVCRACSAMTYRIERNYTIGAPLPTCAHYNYKGGVKCKSCRFRRFSFMSMTATDTRVREVSSKRCPICKKSSYFTRGWKCTKCYYFFLKLSRRKGSMPTCKHNGQFPVTCDGCRLYNLQDEWDKHEFDRQYPLPLVKKN